MKNIIITIGLCCCTALTYAQEIRDASNGIKGYINPDGSVQDQSSNTIGHFNQDGSVWDNHGKKLGYINGLEIQDATHKTISYLQKDGTVENGEHTPLGYLHYSGTGQVTDQLHHIVGNITKVEPMWAAAYFFCFKF